MIDTPTGNKRFQSTRTVFWSVLLVRAKMDNSQGVKTWIEPVNMFLKSAKNKQTNKPQLTQIMMIYNLQSFCHTNEKVKPLMD